MRLAKKRVQCLNEALWFVSSSVPEDSSASKSASSPSSKTLEVIIKPKTTISKINLKYEKSNCSFQYDS